MWQALCGLLIGFICFKFWGSVQPVIVESLEWLTHTVAAIS